MTTVKLKLMIIAYIIVYLLIECVTEINGHFCEKYCCWCVIMGGGVNDPTPGCDFGLGNRSKKCWETLQYTQWRRLYGAQQTTNKKLSKLY